MIEQFAFIFYGVQLLHSLEELSTGFHKKWYLFKMPFWVFLTFEIFFNLFWGIVLFLQNFPFREGFLAFFIILMFANGAQHTIWWRFAKKYVPGLITAFVHIAVSLFLILKLLF